MVDQLSAFADQVTRVARDVGVEGKLGGQAEVRGVSGRLEGADRQRQPDGRNLTGQVRDIANVTTAVANGDLTRKITVEVRGELLELKNTVNTMVDQLNGFSAEVTRVAREVGTEGVLGGQADVRGVSGVWRGLTDNVNLMARNLTEQVRGIARVVTAVANGELNQKLMLDAKGEIATLVETINGMIITLSTFADQVIGVASDVGVEGKLGGQADVPGAAGVWRDLTNNVNELAGNLTRQVRAIGDVATAVTKGDLTPVDHRRRARRGRPAQGQHEPDDPHPGGHHPGQPGAGLAEDQPGAVHPHAAGAARPADRRRSGADRADRGGERAARLVLHGREAHDGQVTLKLFASYAYKERKTVSNVFGWARGWSGRRPARSKRILITDVPTDYVRINSSLGDAVAAQHRGGADLVRGRDQGGAGAGVVPALHRRSSSRSSSSWSRAWGSSWRPSRPR